MPRKPKTKGENPIVGAVFEEVEHVTDVPRVRFRDKKNLDSRTVFARSLAVSFLRLSELGLSEALEPFGLKSTQTVYQAAERVRKAVKADPKHGAAIRKACEKLGVDPMPLLGSERKASEQGKAPAPKMRDMLLASGGFSVKPKKTDPTTGFTDWERGVLAGILYTMWAGKNRMSATLITKKTALPEDIVNSWLVEIEELARECTRNFLAYSTGSKERVFGFPSVGTRVLTLFFISLLAQTPRSSSLFCLRE